MLDRIWNTGLVRKHFQWKMGFVQHPMYLLIDEDRGVPVVGERVPPWGAACAEDYVERVERNLDSFDKYSDLLLNYDFSAVEVEDMVLRFPEVYRKMKQFHEKERLDFVNGTYSQPHLQIYDSEANWRQFEYGKDVFNRYFDSNVELYAAQETGLHIQLPQILKKFGYKFINVPAFPWAMTVTEGNLEINGHFRGMDSSKGDEFVDAVALDGTTMPTYIKTIDPQEAYLHTAHTMREISEDLYQGPTLWTYTPDLEEISEETYNNTTAHFQFAIIKDELARLFKEEKPRAKAQLYTYWSYAEGVWAEELNRANKKAVQHVLMLEGIEVLAGRRGIENAEIHAFIDQSWKTILKYQHHDVLWIEVTDLRQKAINYLNDISYRACNYGRQLVEQISLLPPPPGDPQKMHWVQVLERKEGKMGIALCNWRPMARTAVVDFEQKDVLPLEGTVQEFNHRKFGLVDLPAGCIKVLETGGKAVESAQVDAYDKVETDYYSVQLDASGLISEIKDAKGRTVSSKNDYLGGEIRGMFQDEYLDNREFDVKYYQGPVADVVERSGKISTVDLKETYYYYKNKNLIEVHLAFDFHGEDIGYFWLDETKLNVYWPTQGNEVYHNIPFGHVKARDERVVFANDWVYSNGLVYSNNGNVKHWTRQGVLANVLAWGGNSFSNRMHFGWAKRTEFDIRCYGKQEVVYYLIPSGEFDPVAIEKAVQELEPVCISRGMSEMQCYAQEDDSLRITSIRHTKDGDMVRGFQLPKDQQGKYRDFEIFDAPADEALKFF